MPPKKRPSATSSSTNIPINAKSVKVDIHVLTPPRKAKADPNSYKLIQLQNGLRALLIHEPISNSPEPYWHHRVPNRLGVIECIPSVIYPVDPQFNSLGLSFQKGRGGFSNKVLRYRCRAWSRHGGGLLSNSSFQVEHNFKDEEELCSGCCSETKGYFGGAEVSPADAAFALTINVGSSNDPKNCNGLAHFCEHMVHYGSQKFGGEEDYFNFVNRTGTSANAFTQCMTTTFHFAVPPAHLKRGLEMMGSMIATPLFRKEMIGREANAVDNEFILKESKDGLSELHILSNLAKIDHPLRSFQCGNLQTLVKANGLDNLTKELKSFHKQNYVASAMTLAVQGPHSLETLEDMVIQHFAPLPTSAAKHIRQHTSIQENHKAPFDTDEFRKVILIEGKQSHIQMIVNWALPPYVWKEYKNRALEYLEVLVGSGWEGGLYHQLLQNDLITQMEAGCPGAEVFKNDYATIFRLQFVLADPKCQEKLVPRIQKILLIVFRYFGALKRTTPCERQALWNELSSTADTYFHHSGPGDSCDLTVAASRSLQVMSGEDIFILNSCIDATYCHAKVNELLDMLSPEMMNLMVIIPEAKISQLIGDEHLRDRKIEKYSKAAFHISEFGSNFIKILRNLFDEKKITWTIPRNLFQSESSEITSVMGHPFVQKTKTIAQSPKYFVEHAGHLNARVYKANLRVCIYSAVNAYNIRDVVKLALVRAVMSQRSVSDVTAMNRAGLEFNLGSIGGNVLALELFGFADQFSQAVWRILKPFFGEQEYVSEALFKRAKSVLLNIENDYRRDYWTLSSQLFQELVKYKSVSFQKRKEVLESVSFEEFKSFRKLIANSSFVTAQMEGNASDDHGMQIAVKLNALCYYPTTDMWKRNVPYKMDTRFLSSEARCIRVRNENVQDRNSCICNYYQFGVNNAENQGEIVSFLGNYMGSSAFLTLRTKRQLGYIVSLSGHANFLATPLISVTVIFPGFKQSICQVDKEIDAMLWDFGQNELPKLTQEEFKKLAKLWGLEYTINSVEEVKTFYCKTFMQHIEKIGDSHFANWNSGAGRICKLSIQVIGGGDVKTCKEQRCKNSVWTNAEDNISFTRDVASDASYFIHDIKQFKGNN